MQGDPEHQGPQALKGVFGLEHPWVALWCLRTRAGPGGALASRVTFPPEACPGAPQQPSHSPPQEMPPVPLRVSGGVRPSSRFCSPSAPSPTGRHAQGGAVCCSGMLHSQLREEQAAV